MLGEKGLYLEEIDRRNNIIIDPDNIFWGITKGNDGSNHFVPAEIISLYEKNKKKCDLDINEFRFTSALTAIYIDPTDLCNANCSYCYVPAKIRKNGHSMTEKELKFILTKISKYFKGKKKKPVIVFHASEPLLVKEILFKMISEFKEKFYFGIQTNAILLEKEDVEFIKKNKVSIGISLDAPDEITNNRLRPALQDKGNFRKANLALEWFKGYNGLNVITTITKFNVTKLPALVKFLHEKGVECVLINPMRLTQKNARNLVPDDKTMSKFFIRAINQAIKCSINSKHKIIIGNFANTIIGIIAPVARRLMCDISPCGGGRCFFTITAKGEMIPCGEFIGLNGFSGGNIFNNSIYSAMESNSFRKIRSRFVEKVPECNLCIFRNICGSPCPAELYALGNMYKKSVFCTFYKDIIHYAFKLIAEGKEKYCLRTDGLKNMEYAYKLI